MNINGMGNSMMHGAMQAMQRPNTDKMAQDLFSSIDTDNKGYIEKTDLESAVSKISNTEGMMSSDEIFSLLDGDGDGKITRQEMTSSFEDMATAMSVRMKGNMPPPPPPGGMEQAPSYSQEELVELAESTDDTNMAKLFSQLASNFDEADIDGDGTVSAEEAMRFSRNESDVENNQNIDAQLMRTMSELIKTYVSINESDEGTSSLSVTA